ncbi:alpha/beta fold hydrolase [Cutibacterium equinum]|uniref:Alpha/beta fold hydrolase n=1 Tax=Cutibacterium equinum TaxID=3016342 RepID=A0ABY7R0Y8_9ACTN|nr:alpha/beta fold hydrolase [Cutibacterium equinum]WCC80464.1 alpha/beta fold hydrolase [Cutibacterium equinum]
MDTITITADDGADIDVLVWRPEAASGRPTKGLVQLCHGMAEYAARYDQIARLLAGDGWLVVANDHRGHGARAAATGELGTTPDRGYHQLLDDLSAVADHFLAEVEGKPWFLVGHSMGSFLARVLAARRGREMAGLVAIGTGFSLGPLSAVATGLAQAQVLMVGEDSRSPLLNTLSFGSFNRAFQPARTDYDWLSRDVRVVDAYIHDPLCGFVCTAAFYRELVRLIELANSTEVFRATPPTLPILLMSGAKDPVGDSGRGVRQVARQLRDAGVHDVNLVVYPGARHEILNEVNRRHVHADLRDWIDSVAARPRTPQVRNAR